MMRTMDDDQISSFSSNITIVDMNSSDNAQQPSMRKSRAHTKRLKITPLPSFASHDIFENLASGKNQQSTLTIDQAESFRQRVERAYEMLKESEASNCFYIKDRSIVGRAREHLKQSPDGTFFVCCAEENEPIEDVKYHLNFVCHKKIREVPICCDREHRRFWFLSGYGHGSEVRQTFTGIDVIIANKTKNIFFELNYGFRICLSKPIDSKLVPCLPLPDEVRGKASQTTLLHELALQGSVEYFKELLQIANTDGHELQRKSKFIMNKINGKNHKGHTPLIIAVLAKRYKFVDLLLENRVNINMTDTQHCSPIHHACRHADYKMLKRLLNAFADPYYFNWKETTDGTCQSNLSAFHYLALATDATSKEIEKCAQYLLKHGCPLMPLTQQGKSPFDIAQMFKNTAYECLKPFCILNQFNDASPIEVSSREEAKNHLLSVARPKPLRLFGSYLRQNGNREYSEYEGLFSFYRIRTSKRNPYGEFGLCLYHNREVTVYPITEKHQTSIIHPTDPRQRIDYKYSLITDTVKDDQAQVIVFRSCEELMFSHTKYAGILPVQLKEFVQQKKNEAPVLIRAEALLLLNNQVTDLTNDDDTDGEENEITTDINVTSIDRIHLSQIQSAKLINENSHRFIWLAKVQLEQGCSFPIIIKDYLPQKDRDSYKPYRLSQYNAFPRHGSEQRNTTDERSYEYSSRTHLEYKYESQLMLKDLRNHPLIVHTFLCDQNLEKDLRIFMEYLPQGDLHSYLKKLKPTLYEPLANAYRWIYQIAQAMGYLSIKKIVHGDLAARNILLRNEGHIKISDFGLSRPEGTIPDSKDRIVSARWAAPECLQSKPILSSSADVWSFAVVIWEIYSFGAQPYQADTTSNPQDIVALLKRYLIDYNRRLTAPSLCSDSMYDLMCRCWNGKASKRPKFVDITNDFNGMTTTKDCITPFTAEEREAWSKARDEYLMICKPVATATVDEPEYIAVQDCENDNENYSIVMEF